MIQEWISETTGRTYAIKNVEPTEEEILNDFSVVLEKLSSKGESIDNKKVPDNSAYIKRMKTSNDVMYIYQNGTKVGFSYIMSNSKYWSTGAIWASYVMYDESDFPSKHVLLQYVLKKYGTIRMYPHGSVVSDVKSISSIDSIIAFHQKTHPYITIALENINKKAFASYATKIKLKRTI